MEGKGMEFVIVLQIMEMKIQIGFLKVFLHCDFSLEGFLATGKFQAYHLQIERLSKY